MINAIDEKSAVKLFFILFDNAKWIRQINAGIRDRVML